MFSFDNELKEKCNTIQHSMVQVLPGCWNFGLFTSTNTMSLRKLKKKSNRSRKKQVDYHSILMKASQDHQEKRFEDAEKGYLKVLRRKPDWGQVLNALGTVYLDQRLVDKARKQFESAAKLNPPNLSACYNLARLKQWEGDHDGALEIYKRILEEKPDFGEVWNNIGVAYKETGQSHEALSCYEKAVKFAPEMAEAWNNLGVIQDELNMLEKSSESYTRAIALYPDYSSAHFNLGTSLQKLKRYSEAETHFKKVLQINPEDEAAQFMLQSLGGEAIIPEAAPVEHVRRIFDQCAGTFEKILVDDLEYRTPELLFNLVGQYLTEKLNVLDIGCGTGLGAQLYRPYAETLTGIDVSSKMLVEAEKKRIYDRLEIFDILQDWKFPEKFDVIYSSDVFVYFGNLQEICRSISTYLVPGGIVAFSVELLEDDSMSYMLKTSGRYSHGQQYIEDCLAQSHLDVLECVKAGIRKQSGTQVQGLLVVARKEIQE